jgi:hypothetical protein
MKNSIHVKLIIIVIVLGHSIQAQNWSPLKLNEKFNYNLNGLNFITNVIWTDSVQIQGGDSVFYLNRIVTGCDTCYGFYKWSEQPDFLKTRMIRQGNGIYNFRDPGSFVIKTFAKTGDNWLYDTIGNIQAQVISETYEPVMGINDSVKEIQLSSGYSIRLSKNFGLLQFPSGQGSEIYFLEGIEGRNEGQLVPKFTEIYNFNVGDIFQYSGKSMAYIAPGGGGYGYLEKIKILGKDSIAGQYQYDILRIYCSWALSVQGIPYDTTHLYEFDTLVFQDSVNHLANYYPNQIVENPIDTITCGPNTCYFKVYPDVNQFYTKWIGAFNLGDDVASFVHGTYTTPPRPWFVLVPGQVMIYLNVFKPTLGNTSYRLMVFEYEGQRDLVGYIKNGDTTGYIYPDDFILQGMNRFPDRQELHIYPNPGGEYIQIKGIDTPGMADVEIRNISGELVKKIPYSSPVIISDLNPGIYFIRITDSNGKNWNGRFIKQ